MKEQEDYFSPNHNRLLSIASWAKYLAWVVLIVYVLWAIGAYFQEQNMYLNYGQGIPGQTYLDFFIYLTNFPSIGLSVLVRIIGTVLQGVVYYLVLKGISLGLNMIVETDINYRDRRQKGVTQ
jgi:hypothetical protein